MQYEWVRSTLPESVCETEAFGQGQVPHAGQLRSGHAAVHFIANVILQLGPISMHLYGQCQANELKALINLIDCTAAKSTELFYMYRGL